MRTRTTAVALLLSSGTAIAQNPLGDDSGPNANDGQYDDTRFENIGAGNSPSDYSSCSSRGSPHA